MLSGAYQGRAWAIDSNSTDGDQRGVTIEYLTIEDYQPNVDGGVINQDTNTSWVIRDDTITRNVPASLTFFQNDHWSGNTYEGPSTFYAWNQGNGDNPVSWADWTGAASSGDKCSSSGERQSGYCTGARTAVAPSGPAERNCRAGRPCWRGPGCALTGSHSLFYVGAVAVILMLIPWTHVSSNVSPFVLAWSSLGIAGAASILNAVVLTSAMSSCNSGIFASARMLYSLSHAGQAPHLVRPVNKRKVPTRALAACGVALLGGVTLNIVIPDRAFTDITSVATVAVLWVWGMIVVAHPRFRSEVRQGLRPPQSYRLPGSPWTNYAVLAFIALVVVLLAVKSDQRVALAAGVVWAIILVVSWHRLRRKQAADELTEAAAAAAAATVD